MDTERKDFLGRGWAYPVRIDPRNGAVAAVAYEQDVREAIQIILGTARGERVMHPDFGCGIRDLVFEAVDVATITRIESSIREALNRYEARIDVLSVVVDSSRDMEGLLLIELEYRIRRTNQLGNFVYPFYFKEGGRPPVEGSRA
jgi:uncharacterized protein